MQNQLYSNISTDYGYLYKLTILQKTGLRMTVTLADLARDTQYKLFARTLVSATWLTP